MSGFSDGGNHHVLALLDGEIHIFPKNKKEAIQLCIGDDACAHLSIEQAEELSRALDIAVYHVVQRRKLPDRRAIDRTLCGIGDCNLPAKHPGQHNGSCGCLNGCKAWNCPNI